MITLALILGIASYKDDINIRNYGVPIAVLGAGTALFHYVYQKTKYIAQIFPCSSSVPCNKDILNPNGIITMPLLSLSAFLIIIIFLLLKAERNKRR